MASPWYETIFDENYFRAYQNRFTPEYTLSEVDGVVKLLNLPSGARVLDLCCGFGRHAMELARRGYAVTGLDLSASLLEQARQAAAQEKLPITWIESDMREIPFPTQPYDAVISLFSSFGYLENDAEETKVISAIARVLAPGGRVLIETVNRERYLRNPIMHQWQEHSDGALVASRYHLNLLTSRLEVHELALSPERPRWEVSHSLRLWTVTEVVHLLQQAGFADTAAYGDLAGSRYTWDSYRMVVTADV